MTAQNPEVQAQNDALQDMLEVGIIEEVAEEVAQTDKSDIKGAGKGSPSNNRTGEKNIGVKGTPLTDSHQFTRVSQQLAMIEDGIADKLEKLGKLKNVKIRGGLMAVTAQEYGETTVKTLLLVNELTATESVRVTEYMVSKGREWIDASIVRVALSAYSDLSPDEQEAEQWVVAYGFAFYVNGGIVTKKGKIKRNAITKSGRYINAYLIDYARDNGGYIDVAIDTDKNPIKDDQNGYKMALTQKGRDSDTHEYTIKQIVRVNTPELKEPRKPSSVLLTCENNDGNKESDTCNSEIRIKTSLAKELVTMEKSYSCYCGGAFIAK